MTRSPRRATAAAVLVTAAAVLLGACGSGGAGGDRPAARAGASAAASTAAVPRDSPAGTASPRPGPDTGPGPGAGPGSGSDAGSDPAEAPGSAADAPKVPDARLTPPGGGTFSAPQKSYLSGRVPEGTDPVAVLEGGQELCERLARTARIDPDAAASAIVTGDISRSGATAAVHSLCPAQRSVLDAAAGGFGDGGFAVAAPAVPGTSVAPGAYRAPNPSPSCAWRVTAADGTILSSGGKAAGGATRLTVPAAARGVTSSGCYAWLASGGTR